MEALVEQPREPSEEEPQLQNEPQLRNRLRRISRLVLDVLLDTYRHAVHFDIMMAASSLSYITIASLFPLTALTFVIFKTVGGLERILQTIKPFIEQNLAEGVGIEVYQRIAALEQTIDAGKMTATSLIALAVSSFSLFYNIEVGINRIWETKIRRSIFQRIATYWFFLTFGPVAVAVAVGLASSDAEGFRDLIPSGVTSFVLGTAFFFLVYKFAPSRRVHWVSALVAALFTFTLWRVTLFGFSLYSAYLLSQNYYSRIYGGLTAVAVLIILIFIAWIVVLIGATLSVAIQRQLENRTPNAGGSTKKLVPKKDDPAAGSSPP